MIVNLFLGEELKLTVTKNDYLSHLVEYGMMKLRAAASVTETDQTWVEEDDFQVLMPTLNVQVGLICLCSAVEIVCYL